MNRILRALGASCHETAVLLSEYSDDELGSYRRLRVEAHLAACEACRALYRTLVETVQALRALGAVEPEARPQLAKAVRGRIDPRE